MFLRGVAVAVFVGLYLGLGALAWWVRGLIRRMENDETGWFHEGL